MASPAQGRPLLPCCWSPRSSDGLVESAALVPFPWARMVVSPANTEPPVVESILRRQRASNALAVVDRPDVPTRVLAGCGTRSQLPLRSLSPVSVEMRSTGPSSEPITTFG